MQTIFTIYDHTPLCAPISDERLPTRSIFLFDTVHDSQFPHDDPMSATTVFVIIQNIYTCSKGRGTSITQGVELPARNVFLRHIYDVSSPINTVCYTQVCKMSKE